MKHDVQDELLLNLLNAVERSSAVTQRTLAQELGIALGLANAYLRRCARKGLVKIQQVPANRYAYYLTAHGFSEKARLTAKYLSSSLNLFRAARTQIEASFAECVERGLLRIAVAGRGDLAEIALLCAREYPVEIVAVLEPGAAPSSSLPGISVLQAPTAEIPIDAVILTDTLNPQQTYQFLRTHFEARRIFIPPILGLNVKMLSTLENEA